MALWPEDDVNHLRLVYTTKYAERKPGLDKSEGCRHCIILYYPLMSMYIKRYKRPFWTIEDGPVTGLVSPMSLLYFLAEFPSGAWRLAMSTYLPRLLRSMREGVQGRALSDIQRGTSGLT